MGSDLTCDVVARSFQAWASRWASRHGLIITSRGRTVEHNTEVGGDPLSQHLLGLAVDAQHPTDDAGALADAQVEAEATFTVVSSVSATTGRPYLHVQVYDASRNPLRR